MSQDQQQQDRVAGARLQSREQETNLTTSCNNNNNNCFEKISISENMQANDSNNNVNSTKINLPEEICVVGGQKKQLGAQDSNSTNNHQDSSTSSSAGDSNVAKFR